MNVLTEGNGENPRSGLCWKIWGHGYRSHADFPNSSMPSTFLLSFRSSQVIFSTSAGIRSNFRTSVFHIKIYQCCLPTFFSPSVSEEEDTSLPLSWADLIWVLVPFPPGPGMVSSFTNTPLTLHHWLLLFHNHGLNQLRLLAPKTTA